MNPTFQNTPSTHAPDNAPKNFIALDSIKIASPCRADWYMMDGDDRTRFCQSCTKNVYNLAGMTREQATALIREKNGDVCVRLYRRADGTVITDDCPVGIKIVRRPLKWLVAGFAALLASGGAIFGSQAGASTPDATIKCSPVLKLKEVQPFKTFIGWMDPASQAVTPPMAGGMMPMPPQPAPTSTPKPDGDKEAK
jgi:hypothetical protein